MAKNATPPKSGPSAPSAPASRNPSRGQAAKPGKAQTGVTAPGTGGVVRHRAGQQRPNPSPDTVAPMSPDYAAPETGRRPSAPSAHEDLTPRTHAERNS